MKVLTISTQQLDILSTQLLDKVQESFSPDMLIGIATGGVYISRPMYKQLLLKDWKGSYHEVKLQRASTQTKKRLSLKSLFKILPYPLLNLLRNIESMLSETLKNKPSQNKIIDLDESCITALSSSKKLLLIDDAIDTGNTILAIKEAIYKINPHIEIQVAVLTLTHKYPSIYPKYSLFNSVLLRCPWAEDYKGKDKIA